MASHEFRTPLSALQTSAILISKQNEIDKELKIEKYVTKIKKNVKLMVVKILLFLDKTRQTDPSH
jgi:signal transduction histidine kinase